jgi:hypothetical protein
VSYLAIKVLGPVTVWDVDDDGIWHRLPVRGGAGAAALLGIYVFDRDCDSWLDVASHLWGEVEIDCEPARVERRAKKHASRVRERLGPHRRAVAEGSTPGLVGRDSGAVRVDWDDFISYMDAREWEKALSLIAGNPLAGIRDDKLDVADLISGTRKEVEKRVRLCLKEVDHAVSEPLDLADPAFQAFASARPAEWTPLLPQTKESEPVEARLTEPRVIARRPPSLLEGRKADDLFVRSPGGEKRLAQELREAIDEHAHTWWSAGEWFGNYFAFWFKMYTRSCEEVAITYADDVYDSARFDAPEVDAPKAKATILEAPSFYSDNPRKQITCGLTNWGLAFEWATEHGDEMLAHPSRPSLFGVAGRPVFPGIAGVHVLAQTSDGYLLFGLRAPKIAFYERTWSASFEEQISVGAREFTGPLSGDETLLDTLQGGLFEEWGIEESAVAVSSCLAVGREWVLDQHEGKQRFNFSAPILTACRLNIPLAAVWASLDESAGIQDRDEHRAWAGIRFASRGDVLGFVAAAKERTDNTNLLMELCERDDIHAEAKFYPGGPGGEIRDLGLMPTSAARLVLASGWFETLTETDNH